MFPIIYDTDLCTENKYQINLKHYDLQGLQKQTLIPAFNQNIFPLHREIQNNNIFTYQHDKMYHPSTIKLPTLQNNLTRSVFESQNEQIIQNKQMNLNTTIVVDYVITKLIHKCDKQIYENKITRTIPSYLKQEQMLIIRSAIDLHQINPDDKSNCLNEDEEYTNKPRFDSFQSYTLKMQVPFVKIQIPNQPQRIIKSRQSSLSQASQNQQNHCAKQSYSQQQKQQQQQQQQQQKQQQQQQQQEAINISNQLQKQRSISYTSELEQASFLYQKPNLNNSLQIKLKVKELSKHMFIDRTNPEQFKQQFLSLVQKAQSTDTPQIYRVSRIVGQEPLIKQTQFYTENKSATIKRGYSPNTTSTGTNFRIRKQSIQ